MPTMADVAKEAHVSVATVSRLLNNLGTVSPDTADRVYAAIRKLAYEPNLMARNLRKTRAGSFSSLPRMSPTRITPIFSQELVMQPQSWDTAH